MAQFCVAFIAFLAWISSTFPRPPSNRAVAIAFIDSFGRLGNVAGSYIWPKTWGETCRYSYGICIVTNGLSIVMILAFRARLKALNEKAEREEWDRVLPRVTDIFSNPRNRTRTIGLRGFRPIQILVLHNLAQSGLGHEPLGPYGWRWQRGRSGRGKIFREAVPNGWGWLGGGCKIPRGRL